MPSSLGNHVSGVDDSYLVLGRMPTVCWLKREVSTCIWSVPVHNDVVFVEWAPEVEDGAFLWD